MKKVSYLLSLAGGIFIILVSFYGFFLLRTRPGLPQGVSRDALIQIDKTKIELKKDIEFILSRKAVGEKSIFYLKTDGEIVRREAYIVPFYRQTPFPLIYFLIGLFCFLIGTSVFILRPEQVKAQIFYWLTLAFSSSLIISGEYYCLRQEWLSYLPGIIFCILYSLAPAFLFHFSLSFSRKKFKLSRLLIYCPALILGGLFEGCFLYSSLASSLEVYRFYQSNFYIFRIYVILFVLAAILHLIFAYKKSFLEEEKAQIKWIFFGLFIGLGPFIFLYQIPQLIRIKSLISEEFSTLFFIFIPLSFAISIIKFKLMNIELVINRSLVYSLLTIFTVIIYLFSVQIFHRLFLKFFLIHEMTVSVVGALLAAVAFHPARKRIQNFVDKSFFRQSYDYRKNILSFNEKAQKIINQRHLIDFFLMKVRKILPLEYHAIYLYFAGPGSGRLLSRRGEEVNLSDLASRVLSSDKILTRKRSVQTAENVDFSEENLLEKKDLEMIIPLSFKSTDLKGFLALGKKKSGERFSLDDLELLLTMAGELAINLERIRLQEEVIYERASKEKLDELNRLKTEFISTVSHELRTPMSSIQGLAEILQEGKIKDKAKREELLSLMANESHRLSQLLHNILDFGKIEQHVKTYNFQKVKIQFVINEALRLFNYVLEKNGFILRLSLPETPIFLEIDQDAVKQALINLLDNAIKYSSEKKEIDIRLIDREKEAEIQVEDKGIGIPPEEQDKIFEKFYRVSEASNYNPKGVGLGLKIVKHIMAAHRGDIRVESEVTKGSTFKLIFPKP